MMLFEPKRGKINLQFRSSLSAPTAYIRFIRFFLLIAILCDISPIYSAIVNHSSWVYIVYKLLMVALLSVSFVGFINSKWRGPVFFCGAVAFSSLVYAVEIVVSCANDQPKIAKLLAIILALELFILWVSWRYFSRRRLLFQPDCPHLTPEEQEQVSKEAAIAAEVRAKRAADPFGHKRRAQSADPAGSPTGGKTAAEEAPSAEAQPADAAEEKAESETTCD